MALQLMKIKVDVITQLATTPNDMRFFFITDEEIEAEETLIIATDDFLDDTGAVVTELPVLATNNSYFNVYVNGVLQMEGLCTYTPGDDETGQLEIEVPAGGESILEGTPVVLEIMNYTPSSDNIVNT